MKKKILLSLLCAILIGTNFNYINIHAATPATVNKSGTGIIQEVESFVDMVSYIEENWDNLYIDKDMDLYNSQGKALGKPGDILLTVVDLENQDPNAILLGAYSSHSAMVDRDPLKVLEVLPGGVQNAENDWKTRYRKVLVLRPITDANTIQGAIAYGYTKLGTPFNFNFFDKMSTDKLYCSQFVWRCYYENGLDLDGNGGKAVFPYDFISEKVSIVYKQG